MEGRRHGSLCAWGWWGGREVSNFRVERPGDHRSVAFNRGALFAIDQLHLPVKNAVAGAKRQDFFTGGSIVEVQVDPTQPVMAGMPDRAAIFVNASPAFEPLEGLTGTVLAHYQAAGSCCSASARSGAASPSAPSA